MKRKQPDTSAAEAPSSRQRGFGLRQPRVSCDFCREKKLKCDVKRPCSNCLARGHDCHGNPPPGLFADPHPAAGGGLDVLDKSAIDRIRRLEEAVFGASNGHLNGPIGGHPPAAAVSPNEQSRPARRGQRRKRDTELDYPALDAALASDHCDKLLFHIEKSRREATTPGDSSTASSPFQAFETPRSIWLPSKSDCLSLLQDYVDSAQYFLRAIYPPATRDLVADLYARIPHGQQVSLASVALVLAIAATSAFMWDKRTSSSQCFNSESDAAKQSLVWRKNVWTLLEQTRRVAAGSFEEVQATIILSDLVYNIEGCSQRFRNLQSQALAAAHEISLHLLDSRHASGTEDDDLTREVKRRVWWHMVSTDWLLGTMGGPLDRTYTVNPRHMAVRLPLNINDGHLVHLSDARSIGTGPDTPTDMTYFLQRVRAAEISRQIIDALPPLDSLDSDDVDSLPAATVEALDGLFEDALASFPPCFSLDAPLPPEAPKHMVLQRQVIHLALQARRARLFRPFLAPPSPPQQQQEQQEQDRGAGSDQRIMMHHRRFRDVCLRSAHTVLDIATSLLGGGSGQMLDGNATSATPRLDRSGTVINHLFVASLILAVDPALSATEQPDSSSSSSPRMAYGGVTPAEREARRASLARARRLLERAAEQSAMAAELVRNLVAVLRRHCNARGRDADEEDREGGARKEGAGYRAEVPELEKGYLDGGTADLVEASHPAGEGATLGSLPQSFDHQNGGVVNLNGNAAALGWGYSPPDTLGLYGLWDGLAGTVQAGDAWGQLFADLDSFAGPL